MPSLFFPPYCFCSRRKVRRAVYSAMLPNLNYSREKYCFFFFLVALTDIFFSLGSSFVVISGKQMLYSFIVHYKVSWFGSNIWLAIDCSLNISTNLFWPYPSFKVSQAKKDTVILRLILPQSRQGDLVCSKEQIIIEQLILLPRHKRGFL